MPTVQELRKAGQDQADQRLRDVPGWRYAVEEKGDAHHLGLTAPLNARIAKAMGVAGGRNVAILGVLAGEGGKGVLRDDTGEGHGLFSAWSVEGVFGDFGGVRCR